MNYTLEKLLKKTKDKGLPDEYVKKIRIKAETIDTKYIIPDLEEFIETMYVYKYLLEEDIKSIEKDIDMYMKVYKLSSSETACDMTSKDKIILPTYAQLHTFKEVREHYEFMMPILLFYQGFLMKYN